MPDTLREYPQVEARKHLTKKQKAEVILRQAGRCNGCGIKPKAWEFDHISARWKAQVTQSDLDNWQALGSRNDCNCHRSKTSAEAGERAKMKRCRSDDQRHADKMKAKATLARSVFKRQQHDEQKSKGNRAISSRSSFGKRVGVSSLSKKHPRYFNKGFGK